MEADDIGQKIQEKGDYPLFFEEGKRNVQCSKIKTLMGKRAVERLRTHGLFFLGGGAKGAKKRRWKPATPSRNAPEDMETSGATEKKEKSGQHILSKKTLKLGEAQITERGKKRKHTGLGNRKSIRGPQLETPASRFYAQERGRIKASHFRVKQASRDAYKAKDEAVMPGERGGPWAIEHQTRRHHRRLTSAGGPPPAQNQDKKIRAKGKGAKNPRDQSYP